MDLNESISNDWTFMKRQIKPPLKIIGRENTDNIILVERNVHKWGVALRSSNPVSLSSRTNMAIQTLQLQIKVITVITKVCLSWPKINATELHFARSFQGYPTWPYLAHSNARPKYCIWCIWARIWVHQVWSSGVSLKRSCKMQFRRVDPVSIGPPVKN